MGASVKSLHFSTLEKLVTFSRFMFIWYVFFLARLPAIWRRTRRMTRYPQEGVGEGVIRDAPLSAKMLQA